MVPDLLNIGLCWTELKSVAKKRGCPPSHLYRNKDVGTAAAAVGFLWLIAVCIQWIKSFLMLSCKESCFFPIPRFRLSSAPACRYSFLASLISFFTLLFSSPVVALLWIPYFWRIASRNFSRSSSVFSCFACRCSRYAWSVRSLRKYINYSGYEIDIPCISSYTICFCHVSICAYSEEWLYLPFFLLQFQFLLLLRAELVHLKRNEPKISGFS